MQNINSVAISGNLTRDPKLMTSKAGNDFLTFSIASNDRRKNSKTDEWEDVPNFVDVVYFGGNSEALSEMLQKGSKVFVSGSLRYSTWTNDDDEKRSKLEIVAQNIEIMPKDDGGKKKSKKKSRDDDDD